MPFNIFFYFLIFIHLFFHFISLCFGFGFANAVGCSVPLTRLLSVCHLLCVACAFVFVGDITTHEGVSCWRLVAGGWWPATRNLVRSLISCVCFRLNNFAFIFAFKSCHNISFLFSAYRLFQHLAGNLCPFVYHITHLGIS